MSLEGKCSRQKWKNKVKFALIAERVLEESRRDDSTILLLHLPLKATEKDIYEFFAKVIINKLN